MKCENCKVQVNSLSDNCPLCGKYISPNSEREQNAYPHLNRSAEEVKHSEKVKIILFLTIVFTIFMFTINLLTPHRFIWSMIPISAVWLIWLVFGIPIIKKKITPLMIFQDNIIISIFLIIIDVTLKQNGWAMSYVVPFILSGSAFVITLMVMYIKMTWKEFYLFQMTIVAICFIPIVTRLFFRYEFGPSIVSAIYGLVTILAMAMFGDKKFKYETKKRLHF
jgi:hypothetical protein